MEQYHVLYTPYPKLKPQLRNARVKLDPLQNKLHTVLCAMNRFPIGTHGQGCLSHYKTFLWFFIRVYQDFDCIILLTKGFFFC